MSGPAPPAPRALGRPTGPIPPTPAEGPEGGGRAGSAAPRTSWLRGKRLAGVLVGATVGAALLALFLRASPGPPRTLWVPEASMNGGAGFEIRERDPDGRELREGWTPFVPSGKLDEFHLHYTGGPSTGFRTKFGEWWREVCRAADCALYRSTDRRMTREDCVWLEFERRGASGGD